VGESQAENDFLAVERFGRPGRILEKRIDIRDGLMDKCQSFTMPKKLHTLRKRATRQELRDMDQEILFLEGLIRRDETYVEALQILGDDYTRRGRYAEGLTIDERLCKLRPDDALVRYNLACSYSLTHQLDLALESVETAINLGYRDFKWMAQDPDLENLRKNAAYQKIKAIVRQIRVKRAKII
jgi:tetratricopeptide (TPR) repeat protein